MSKYRNTLTSLILEAFDLDRPGSPFENPLKWAYRKDKENKVNRQSYRECLWRMQRQGYLEIVEKNNKKFIKLTKKGQLEKLLREAYIENNKEWDGKWRLLIFDIPEKSREKRDCFRTLLRSNNFIKLQGSVYISPYPLNRSAVRYLNDTGLSKFIRIMRIDEMDKEEDLLEKYHLIRTRP